MNISCLDRFANDHHSLVTRRAAADAGISARTWYRMIEHDLLEQLHPGVCRMFGAAPTPVQAIHAAVLAAGKGGYEVDFRIIDSPLILECDGWTTHGRERAQFERDRTRDAELAALGFVVLRFTYRAIVKRPAQEAERIRRIVQQWAPHVLAAA